MNSVRFFIFVSFLLLAGCDRKTENNKEDSFVLSELMMQQCEFFNVKLEDVRTEVRFFGKLEADNNKTAQVFSVVGGVVNSINVSLGDYVRQGDILAEIQSTEIAHFQKQKLDALNDLAVADKNLQVAHDLFAGKLTSEKDLISAEREFEKAKAEVSRINDVYSIYNINNSSVFSLRAPISGFVISKKININELLLSGDSDPLFSIANTDEIHAVAYVNESSISIIREGLDVEISTIAFPETIYKGKIEKIYNVLDPATRSIRFRVRLKNEDFRLKPEMNCTVGVSYLLNRKLISVPSGALIFDKNKFWVMVFKNTSNIETRQVEIFEKTKDSVFILHGLNEGETIISVNGLLVYDAIND